MEPLSQYLDCFLGPLLKSVPSLLLDTKEGTTRKLRVRPGFSLATIDVVSLYSQIQHTILPPKCFCRDPIKVQSASSLYVTH